MMGHTYMVTLSHTLTHTHTHTHTQTCEQPFDDVQYSEVRKGPLYQPPARKSPSPQLESTTSPPPSKPPRDSIDASGGLSELDNLLAMLNDTQLNIEDGMYVNKLSICTNICICMSNYNQLAEGLL